jgi:hypothetical protein
MLSEPIAVTLQVIEALSVADLLERALSEAGPPGPGILTQVAFIQTVEGHYRVFRLERLSGPGPIASGHPCGRPGGGHCDARERTRIAA